MLPAVSRTRLSQDPRHALNAICPYFTMFPLEFPLRILRRHRDAQVVLDPFCGRGTTLFAARTRGMRGVGIDTSRVAAAISQAKLAHATVTDTLRLARRLLDGPASDDVPGGDFWKSAYHEKTLEEICRLRDGLRRMKRVTDEAALLRGAILGILHGPQTTVGSYLSNQMPRTFAPKPAYAVKFWTERKLIAPRVSVLNALERKLRLVERNLGVMRRARLDDVIVGNAASKSTYIHAPRKIDVVITSPPYYGMRTYVPDQWLRHWFLGGLSTVDYAATEILPSSSPDDFAEALGRTWANVAVRARNSLHLYVRFGAIPSRDTDPKELLRTSLEKSKVRWDVISIRNAQNAHAGKRQATSMRTSGAAVDEIDLHAIAT